MSNDSRKARLTREALGNAEGDMRASQGNLRVIAALLVVLFAAGAVSGLHSGDGRVTTAAAHGAP
jgi:hypothetical protein